MADHPEVSMDAGYVFTSDGYALMGLHAGGHGIGPAQIVPLCLGKSADMPILLRRMLGLESAVFQPLGTLKGTPTAIGFTRLATTMTRTVRGIRLHDQHFGIVIVSPSQGDRMLLPSFVAGYSPSHAPVAQQAYREAFLRHEMTVPHSGEALPLAYMRPTLCSPDSPRIPLVDPMGNPAIFAVGVPAAMSISAGDFSAANRNFLAEMLLAAKKAGISVSAGMTEYARRGADIKPPPRSMVAVRARRRRDSEPT